MKGIYDWVPWFRDLARNIAEGGEQDLIDKAKDVMWVGGEPALLQYGDENIDPFSFFCFLSSKISILSSRALKQVYESVHEVFEIDASLPDMDNEHCIMFPRGNFQKALFHNGQTFNRSLLWSLFKQVVEDTPNIDPADFKKVLAISSVAVTKLTQTLFLINAEYFLPIDQTTKVVLETLQDLSFRELKRNIKENGLQEYLSVVEGLKKAFPECRPYEIARFSYLQSKSEVKVSGKFFHVSTNVYGPGKGDYWEDFKENNWVYTGGSTIGPTKGEYPLSDPEPGDGILVRTGMKQGRAIGIVYKNDHAESRAFNEESRIHVLWINKSEHSLSGNTEQVGFNKTEKDSGTYSAFEKTEGYNSSLKLIERLAPNSFPDPQLEPDDMKHPLNRILYGPPGTGKTWNTVNYAVAIAEKKDVREVEGEMRKDVKNRFDELKEHGRIAMVTFHQSFTYEDFIEGIRPVLNDESGNVRYELSKGIFREVADQACEHKENNYVLIIDEINRGNIAKIFGELITLIEPSKRVGRDDEARVILPYSRKSFGVPDNLYVVGTMNTADRSIALLDTALRRRFEFVEMMPKLDIVHDDVDGVNCRKLLETMNERITRLLDREHQIGHTYFLDVKDMEFLKRTFQNKIIPLLQEYFYNDWEKIDVVLNGNGFIRKVFRDSHLSDREGEIYEWLPVDDDGWQDPGAYRTIYNHERDSSLRSE